MQYKLSHSDCYKTGPAYRRVVMSQVEKSSDRELVAHLDGSVTEYSYFEPSAGVMDKLVRVLFEAHWRDITVGPVSRGRFSKSGLASHRSCRCSMAISP